MELSESFREGEGMVNENYIKHHTVHTLLPGAEPDTGIEHLCLPKPHMAELVRAYVAAMETQVTADWCKCSWKIHPDDVEMDTHNCRNCHHPALLHVEITSFNDQSPVWTCNKNIGEPEPPVSGDYVKCDCTKWTDPPRRRMLRLDTHDECSVHTKEGLVLGFFEWVFKVGQHDPKR